VRRGNDDDAIELLALEERVAVGCHFPGIDVACMGSDERDQVSGQRGVGGLRQIVIDQAAEFFG